MIFETNTQKSDITSAGGDGSGERADRRDQPVVYFVLPCYNEAEGSCTRPTCWPPSRTSYRNRTDQQTKPHPVRR